MARSGVVEGYTRHNHTTQDSLRTAIEGKQLGYRIDCVDHHLAKALMIV